jgi:beta-glucosidase-like glycosyl hydrolase
MSRLDIIRYATDEEYRQTTHELVTTYGVLGFCIFGGTKELVKETITKLQELRALGSDRILLFSIDAEWGAAMRITDGIEYPHAFALAKTNDASLVEEVGFAIGAELKVLGIHWNFAPVADINSNPKNPIINIRSFGESAEEVSKYSVSFHRGLRKAGMLSSAKHFPGHGDTVVDSHQGLPSISRSYEEFARNELLPFEALIADGVPSVMLGHLAAPQLAREFGATSEEALLPATILSPIVTKLLRERMGYGGVIITDSLEMAGIRKLGFTDAEIAVKSIQSGVDILLMPPDPVGTFNALKESGIELNNTRIEKLFDAITSGDTIKPDVELPLKAARKAIHIKGNVNTDKANYLVIHKDNEQDANKAEILKSRLNNLTDTPSDSTIIIILDRPRGQLVEEKQSGGIQSKIESIIAIYKAKNLSPRGIILLGNPYLEESFAAVKPGFVIQVYSDSLPSIHAVLETIINE